MEENAGTIWLMVLVIVAITALMWLATVERQGAGRRRSQPDGSDVPVPDRGGRLAQPRQAFGPDQRHGRALPGLAETPGNPRRCFRRLHAALALELAAVSLLDPQEMARGFLLMALDRAGLRRRTANGPGMALADRKGPGDPPPGQFGWHGGTSPLPRAHPTTEAACAFQHPHCVVAEGGLWNGQVE
jgi:hypothetical protein